MNRTVTRKEALHELEAIDKEDLKNYLDNHIRDYDKKARINELSDNEFTGSYCRTCEQTLQLVRLKFIGEELIIND